ncbi:hypothetical protein GALMADRAFT_814951 [Galerina marginata CBS 339.88]|uniref:Granulins domain-containing protein n=1 Tax=Galerina marginata (strain CBS 339.88) TaxID=685588 RepID=A0A067SJB8_GALM3|nr:hypothetical protein GALMADRAFT_814951 [Galerina marginata CBS 339.88]
MHFTSALTVLVTAVAFASQTLASPAPQPAAITHQCSGPAEGHLKCPFGYRCCGPFVNGLGSCIPGEAGICPLIS